MRLLGWSCKWFYQSGRARLKKVIWVGAMWIAIWGNIWVWPTFLYMLSILVKLLDWYMANNLVNIWVLDDSVPDSECFILASHYHDCASANFNLEIQWICTIVPFTIRVRNISDFCHQNFWLSCYLYFWWPSQSQIRSTSSQSSLGSTKVFHSLV